MSLLGKLAAQIRSYPSAAAAYLLSRLTAVENSVSGLAADGGPYTCLAGDAVLDAVYLSAADTIALADADNASKIPAVGILISKDSDTEANVRFAGVVSGFVGLTAGAIYYLSATAGDITTTPPSAPHAAPIGIAVSTTKLLVLPLGVMSAVLKSTVANLGASVIGIQDALTLITAATVEGALAELAQFKADLGSIVNGKGLSLVAFEDAAGKTTAANGEAALAEIFAHIVNGGGVIELRPQDFYLATGAPLAIFAGGASAVPGMAFVDSKALGIRWNDNATHNAVATSFRVPPDLNIASNASVRVICSKTGATLADAATFDIGAFNQVLAALHDADADYGGTSAAITGDAVAKTLQSSALTLLAANLAAAPASVTLTLKPTDGTLATADDLVVHGVYVLYTKKATS